MIQANLFVSNRHYRVHQKINLHAFVFVSTALIRTF